MQAHRLNILTLFILPFTYASALLLLALTQGEFTVAYFIPQVIGSVMYTAPTTAVFNFVMIFFALIKGNGQAKYWFMWTIVASLLFILARLV
jgi:hypothetical protein